jgi:hypothetical protein
MGYNDLTPDPLSPDKESGQALLRRGKDFGMLFHTLPIRNREGYKHVIPSGIFARTDLIICATGFWIN